MFHYHPTIIKSHKPTLKQRLQFLFCRNFVVIAQHDDYGQRMYCEFNMTKEEIEQLISDEAKK